ncbi:helix-turn-helix domain-containing protein [Pontimicrobium sp. MEBiC06410]
MINSYEKDTSYNIKGVRKETIWLKKLIYTGLIICICWLIAIIIVMIYNLDESYFFYPMWLGISVLVYWIGYVGLTKSKLLQERIELREKRKNTTVKKEEEKKEISSKTKAFEKLENEIINNKAYLNPKLSLEQLSNTLNLNESYISQQIKLNSNMSFNDYINNLRIKNAKQILGNKDYDNYTIVSIGLESGFNSKSSFYTAFKKFTNKTPAQYKKDVRNL